MRRARPAWPAQVRVGAPTNDESIAIGERLELFVELRNFGRTNKRKVLRIKKVDDPLACIVCTGENLYVVLPNANACLY